MNAKLWPIGAGVLLVHLMLLGWLRSNSPLPHPDISPMQVSLRMASAMPQATTRTTPTEPVQSKPTHRGFAAPATRPSPIIQPATPIATQPAETETTGTHTAPPTQPTADRTATVATPLLPPSAAALPQVSQAAAGTPDATPVAASPSGALPQAKPTPVWTLPSASADYLDNPPPPYPAQSWRRGEQGTVLVRTLISKDGRALDAVLAQSSGFDRLDRTALQAVMQWRYRPATLNGVTQELWFDVPVMFKLP